MSDFADRYQKATSEFLEVAQKLTEIDLDKDSGEGWTPRQVIHHMADSEAQSYARLRRLLAEPGTQIQGYDEAKWAEHVALGYRTLPIAESLAVINAVRASTYTILSGLREEDLNNSGMHSESGLYSIRDWLNSYINHPRDHAQQILEVL